MKKGIEWLKREIPNLRGYAVIIDGEDGEWEPVTTVSMEDIYELINQLDKLEVLSQEWIDEKAIHIRGLGNIIEEETIKNLLVPKPELPVIPEFVAEWIEEVRKQDKTLIFAITHIYAKNEISESPNEEEKRIFQWMESSDNEEVFARAWLNGFTVEEEPLYRARLKVITDEFIASYLCTQSSDAQDRLKALEIGSKYIHEDYRHLSEFTEDELKKLNIWDSEQWEVEEVEE